MKNILLLLATVLWVGSVSVRPAIASEPAPTAEKLLAERLKRHPNDRPKKQSKKKNK